jgi:SAM-dependent methyltransferase
MNGQDAALPYIGKGPVLDAGCNRGELLLQLRSLGFEAEGLEFNGPAVEECRKLGFNVCLGDVTNAELPPTRYRTIILQHTLEHLTEPVSDLRKLAKSLVDSESAIVIVVPHVGSPVRRWFGDSWHGWDPPFHICQYTPKTLASLAERAGLRMHRYRLIFAPDDYTRSLALATCKPGRRLLLRLLLIPPMKLMQLFGYGGILVAELRPAPVRGD